MALRSMAMADVQLQAAICSGGSWWSDARVGSSHVDDPTPVMWAPFSCSPADHLSSTADDGHFNWQPAASPGPLDATVTTSDEAAGSYNTATFYQDIEYPGDAYGSMAVVLDSCSTQVFDSDLFCTWSRPFLSTPIVDEETGVHSLIQEDIYSSRPCCPQEPGIGFGSNQIHEFVGSTDPLDHLEGIHATSSNAALCSVLFPASSSLLLETSSPFSAGGWHSQLPKAMPKQQFTNVEAPVWVPCVSNAAKACSRALHQSAPTPLAVQEINVKANSGSKNSSSTCSEDIASSEPVPKKARIETPLPTFKVRKEKLGDRITLLQQLVSPFGKTDTASVLHEAIDYIKFLHDQVQVLSTSRKGQKQEATKIPNKDLRSRGLCLVPISSTVQMLAREAPVDLWPLGFGADYS